MTRTNSIPPEDRSKLPWAGLLALSMAAFITILTEALPAGLLPAIGQELGVSEASAGQLVTVYALGSLLAAIPLTAMTRGLRRRPLLLAAIIGFLVANTVTAVSERYTLTLFARFVGGVAAGLLWALAAGYAARMAPDRLKGRAIAVAMAGTPLALSLGVPAGTYLGGAIGWRGCFWLMSGLTVILIAWVLAKVPDFAGEPAGRRLTLRDVIALPGIVPVLGVVLTYVLAHNILYTYIAPFLGQAGLTGRTDTVLLVFGLAALVSIWAVGVLIDARLRALTLASLTLFGAAALIFWFWASVPAAVYLGSALWGLAFGGSATLFQTASARAAGSAADLAQSMLVTMWNTAIAGGGLVGGVLLERFGVQSFAPTLLGLLALALVISLGARRHGFPGAGTLST